MRRVDWSKYVIAFIITAAMFATAFYVSALINERRAVDVRAIEEDISIDILSLETQFDLLEEVSCEAIEENSVLTRELDELGRKLEFTESQLGTENEEVLRLKRAYSLLLIKDFLLMKRVAQKCDIQPIFLFYFYSNQGDCPECTRQGYVLTRLQDEYPRLRIYPFDYNLDLSALTTLRSIYGVEDVLPALVIHDEIHYGFRSVSEIKELLPNLETIAATSTATSTTSTTSKNTPR